MKNHRARKPTIVRFRARLIKRRLDRRLIERTVELAKQTGGFGPLKFASRAGFITIVGSSESRGYLQSVGSRSEKGNECDSSPAGGGADGNSDAHGSRISQWFECESSTGYRHRTFQRNVQKLYPSCLWLCKQWKLGALQNQQLSADNVEQNLKVARQVQSQDVEVTAKGKPQLRRGVAKNRRVSVEDPTMRHGRKSRNKRFDGYKRHVLTDLDLGVVRAVGLTPANVPEAWVSDAISNDLKAQDVTLVELQIDRAYLSSKLVRHRTEELNIYCKAWPVRSRDGRFPKTSFVLDWEAQKITCPNQITLPFEVGALIAVPQIRRVRTVLYKQVVRQTHVGELFPFIQKSSYYKNYVNAN